MYFPDTVEEFMERYKMTDTKQVYSNGTVSMRSIPSLGTVAEKECTNIYTTFAVMRKGEPNE